MTLGARRGHQLGTTAPSGITTPAARAESTTMPRSLWCRSMRKLGVKSWSIMPAALRSRTAVAREAAGEHLDRGREVDRLRVEEVERLRHEADRAGGDELVRRLDGLSGTGRSNVDDRLAECVEHWPCGVEVRLGAAHHDRQHAVDRALLAAADRGVERAQAGVGGPLGDVPARSAGAIVLMSIQSAPSAVSTSSATASTSGESGSIVITTSASRTASATESAARAPWSASRAAFAGLRL